MPTLSRSRLWQLTKLTVQAWLANRAQLIPIRKTDNK